MNKIILLSVLTFSHVLIAQMETSEEQQVYQQSQERKRIQKRKVREKNYPGARVEGELLVQPDIITTKDKRKKEKEERQGE